MWKERNYYLLIMTLGLILLFQLCGATNLIRNNGNVTYPNIPITALHFDMNGLEKIMDANYTRDINTSCYWINLTVQDAPWKDIQSIQNKTMNWNTFLLKYNIPLTQKQASDELIDMLNGYTWATTTGNTVKSHGVINAGKTIIANTCFTQKNKTIKAGLYSIYISLVDNNITQTISPETAKPTNCDWARGQCNYSQKIIIKNDGNNSIVITSLNFGANGIIYWLSNDSDSLDGNIIIPANTSQNFYINYYSDKPKGKYDEYFYWNGNNFLIDPYWVRTANTDLNINWYKSFYVYQSPLYGGLWTPTNSLDWNSASDNNYTVNGSSWDTNLILYYQFNTQNVSTIFDVARGRNGTAANLAKINGLGLWDSNALQLNGSNQKVEVPITASIKGSSQATISAWIDANQCTATLGGFPIIYAENTTASNATRIYLSLNTDCSVNCTWRDSVHDPLGTSTSIKSSNKISLLNWHNIVCTINADTNKQHIYIDGIDVNNSSLPMTKFANTNPSGIGLGYMSLYAQYFYKGLIDELKIYNKALTETEVLIDYNSFLSAKFRDLNSLDSGNGSGEVFNYRINKLMSAKGVGKTDLNFYGCTDSVCNTITDFNFMSDINNNVTYDVNLTNQYFNYDLYFKTGSVYDGNAGSMYIGNRYQDINEYWENYCNPSIAEWDINTYIICTNSHLDITPYDTNIQSGGYLDLRNSDLNTGCINFNQLTFFGIQTDPNSWWQQNGCS